MIDGNAIANYGTSVSFKRGQFRALLIAFSLSFLFSACLLSLVQFAAPNIVDYDGYYHIKMALLMRQQGLPLDFPWLPLTLLNRHHFTDVHTLFHILQIPFTFLGDLRVAAKLSAVFFAAGCFGVFASVLFVHKVRYIPAWI